MKRNSSISSPDFLAAGEAFPVLANRPDQLVTFIDRRDEICAPVAHTIRQQRFDIRLHLLKSGLFAASVSHAVSGKSDSVAPAGTRIIAIIFSQGVE